MSGTKLTRRAILAGMAVAPFAGPASAQADWPTRPVRVMVPYPPAGGADTTARIVYAKLSQTLGQQFVVENKGGAGGTIAEALLAKADPDGYYILHDGTAFSVNGALYPNLSFDYNKDFDPVGLVSLVPNILVVTPDLDVKTMADVIAYAKAQPGGIEMASSGNGTLQHLCLEMFRHVTGLKITHVPYRGGGLAVTDVMAGQVKFFFANGSSVVGLLPGFEANEWNGVFAPRGTPQTIVRKLNAGLNEALRSPEVTARFAQLNIVSHPNTPEEFQVFVEGQMKLWSGVVKEANIKLG